jgi:hypothetical protein
VSVQNASIVAVVNLFRVVFCICTRNTDYLPHASRVNFICVKTMSRPTTSYSECESGSIGRQRKPSLLRWFGQTWGCFYCGKIEGVVLYKPISQTRVPAIDYSRRVKNFEARRNRLSSSPCGSLHRRYYNIPVSCHKHVA